MHKTLVAMLLVIGAVAVQGGSQIASGEDFPKMSLRNARTDVMSVYSDLSLRPMTERRVLFRTLSPGMQSDLWIVNLQQFLVAHPELTVEQRSVVFEGLGILGAGVFDSADKAGELYIAARNLESRAKTLISTELLREAFVDLGGRDVASPLPAVFAPRRTPRTLDDVNCACATTDDWCGDITGVVYCARIECTFTTGCGWIFLDACNGLCT